MKGRSILVRFYMFAQDNGEIRKMFELLYTVSRQIYLEAGLAVVLLMVMGHTVASYPTFGSDPVLLSCQ